MKDLRKRFCVPGTWKIRAGKVVYHGAASIAVRRYRYRGNKHPDPLEPSTGSRRPRRLTIGKEHVESPVR